MKMVPIGGRIKSASVGLDHLYTTDDIVELDSQIRRLRKKPSRKLLEAFFPSDSTRLKQLMRGVGLYHPVLKTEQGMGGNFLPFFIDPNSFTTDLSAKKIYKEEGIAIPEPYYYHDPELVYSVQKAFSVFNLEKTDEILQRVGSIRDAAKGRTPFFLIRPAITDQKIIFGHNIIDRVTEAVNKLLQDISQRASEQERRYSGDSQDSNLLYCQPDVFILMDGTVAVEKINCPDVGLFLIGLQDPFSTILPVIQRVVSGLRKAVCQTLASNIGSQEIGLVTRDEVFIHQEDLLEIGEIESLKQGLAELGVQLRVYPVSKISEIPTGQAVLLLNIDYEDNKTNILFDRHCRGEIIFYPNPFFQMACQKATGLQEILVPQKHQDSFLRLVGSTPKEKEGLILTWQRLDKLLCKYNVTSDIIHADISKEVVPIFRRSMHSWRVLNKRASRYNEKGEIKLRSIPAKPDNLIITSDTGPRLHTFRFMFIR